MAPSVLDSGQEAALERCEVIRELGARANPVYVARHSAAGGKPRLVILERFPGAAKGGDEKAAAFVREAKRIAALLNPNVTRLREVITHGDDVLILSDYLDGERLRDLWTLDERHPALELSLRILFDVLGGIGVLHDLKDTKQQPLGLVHGELSPMNVLVGLDGTSRLMFSAARRAPGATPAQESIGYLAPPEETVDARADVFSAGVLLWEALSGRALFPASEGPVTADRARTTSPPTVPEKASWARPLVDIAAKALAPLASDRFASTAAMLTEMRKAVGVKIAASSSVASFMKSTYGERIQARRLALEGGAPPAAASGTRTAAAAPSPGVPKAEPSGPKLEGSAPKLAVAPRKPGAAPPSPPVLKVPPPPPSSQPELAQMPAIVPTLIPAKAAPPPPPRPVVEELDEADLVSTDSSDSIPSLDPALEREKRDSDMPTAVVDVPLQPRPSDVPTKMHAAEDLVPKLQEEPSVVVAEPDLPLPEAAAEAPAVVAAMAEPSLPPPGEEGAVLREQLRRRRMQIFGGVGALGAVMLVLTVWRLTHNTAEPPDLSTSPPAASTSSVVVKSIKGMAPPTMQTAAVPTHVDDTLPPSTDSAAALVTPPPPPVVKPKPAPPASAVVPPPAPVAKRPASTSAVAAAPSPAKPKPRPTSKPKFDPSSL